MKRFIVSGCFIVVLSLVLLNTGCGVSFPKCSNCMLYPADNQDVYSNAVPHIFYPVLLAGCIAPAGCDTEIYFGGEVQTPKTEITIEVYEPEGKRWDNLVQTNSIDSKTGPPYVWGKWAGIPDYDSPHYWQAKKNPDICAYIERTALVRSKLPEGPLNSVIFGWIGCAQSHPDTFESYCLAPETPVAHVVNPRDFGQECADLINLIRDIEGNGKLAHLKADEAGECLADNDAMINYKQGPHASRTFGIAQNDCHSASATITDILQECIWDGMYHYEKWCLQNNICNDPSCSNCGHYLHMISPDFDRVACGIYLTDEGKFYSVQDFAQP